MGPVITGGGRVARTKSWDQQVREIEQQWIEQLRDCIVDSYFDSIFNVALKFLYGSNDVFATASRRDCLIDSLILRVTGTKLWESFRQCFIHLLPNLLPELIGSGQYQQICLLIIMRVLCWKLGELQ